jgi:hypothetical protein
MTIRSFIDAHGVRWRAWSTQPIVVSRPLSSRAGEDWLTFDAVDGRRRRLSPVPEEWSAASLALLEAYCESADRVGGRTRRDGIVAG